jgi:hypothetical protein
VKYMLMIYENAGMRDAFISSPEGQELMEEMREKVGKLEESGELLYTHGLADESNTKTVHVRDGVPAVTDGPLAEAKEIFGGYLLVETETLDRAVEIAASLPNTRYSPMEVRPVMDPAGAEM